MALPGQTEEQMPHPWHRAGTISALWSSLMRGAPYGHSLTHVRQTAHFDRINLGDDPGECHLLLAQQYGRPLGSRGGLGYGFVDRLRVMGKSGQEHAFSREVHGPQLHVSFHEVALGIHGDLEQLPQFLVGSQPGRWPQPRSSRSAGIVMSSSSTRSRTTTFTLSPAASTRGFASGSYRTKIVPALRDSV